MPIAKWNNQSYFFNCPAPDSTLLALRQLISDHFSLEPTSFKLVHAGALMRDDNAPISAYKIHQNSKIAVIASDQQRLSAPQQSEQTTISLVQSEMISFRAELSLSVTNFLFDTESSQQSPSPEQLQERTRLGELLLQRLLRLDAISTDGQWDEARKQRKIAIKEIQGLLDRLDNLWK